MKFLLSFDNKLVSDTVNYSESTIPHQIIDENIRCLISKPLPFELFLENISSLLPLFTFYCGYGASHIHSHCQKINLRQKRPFLFHIKSKDNRSIIKQSKQLIHIENNIAYYLYLDSPWILSSSIDVISDVLAMLNSKSQLNRVFDFINCDHKFSEFFESKAENLDSLSQINVDLFDQVHIHNSRKGFDTTKNVGATFPYELPPPPLMYRPAYPLSDSVKLKRIDFDKLTDDSFLSVISKRRSNKSLDTKQFLSLEELTWFLGLVFLTSNVYYRTPDIPNTYDSCRRFYPNGGGVHELEPFVICNRISDFRSGVYHYSPLEHHLTPVSYEQSDVNSMILEAYISSNKESIPAAFIILTSRLDRLAWKYERMAYHVTLKNTGVILGYMSQVATFLNLYGCPMGNSDTYRFSKIIREDPLKMPSVGEFCLSPS